MAMIKRPGPLDLAAWRTLLAAEKMRTEDLGAEAGFWLVAWESGALVGGAGLELGADSALLRSVVVAAPLRGRGLGRAMVEACAEKAGQIGCSWLYAFSSEAPRFLIACGFRETTPSEIAAALPDSRQVALYARLKWLDSERAFRRSLSTPKGA